MTKTKVMGFRPSELEREIITRAAREQGFPSIAAFMREAGLQLAAAGSARHPLLAPLTEGIEHMKKFATILSERLDETDAAIEREKDWNIGSSYAGDSRFRGST